MAQALQTDGPGAKTLIVGLGATGLSCARHLAKQGVQVAVADSRSAPPGLEALNEEYPDIAVFLGPFDDQLCQESAAWSTLLSSLRGVPLRSDRSR